VLNDSEFISYARFLQAQDRRRRLAGELAERDHLAPTTSAPGTHHVEDPGPEHAAPRH
jgi:hypothetical protein